MENIINIATLTIDTQKASDQIVSTRKEIFELQKANTDLRKAIVAGDGDVTEQTRKFVEQEQKIKALQASYRQQSTALNEYTLENVKNSTALNDNVKSINQANDQNKELIKTRNQVDASTKDGAEAIRLINLKLDENNKFIKSNSSELEKQKQNVGNYASALENVDGVLAKFGFNGAEARNVVAGFQSTVSTGAKGFVDFSNSAVNAGAKLIGFKTSAILAAESASAVSVTTEAAAVASTELAAGQAVATSATAGATLGLKGFTLALAATGIGLLVIGVGLLVNYFKDFDPLIDKIEQGLAAVGAVVNVLSKAMASLFLQTDKNSGSFDNLGDKMASAAKRAIELKAAQQDLEDLQKSAVLTNAQLSEQAERFLIQSKDKTKTEAQRIELLKKSEAAELSRFKLNEKLINLEIQNAQNAIAIKAELTDKEIANLKRSGTAYAQYLQSTGKITDAQLKSLTDAEVKGVESRKESNKFLEKNINAQNKLREDQDAAVKKSEDDAKARAEKNKAAAEKQFQAEIKNAQNKIDIIKLEAKENDITAEQKIATAQKVFNLENELAKKSLSGSDEQKKLIEIRQNLSNEILSIATSTINGEIEAQKKLIDTKKNISETEKNDLLKNAQFLKQTETDRINASVLSATDKAAALLEIETGYQTNVEAITTTFKDAEKTRKEEQAVLDALDFELKLATLEDQGLTENELKKQILEAEHAEKIRLIGLQLDAEGNLTAAAKKKLAIEEKKYAVATKLIDDQVKATKIKAVFEIAQKSIQAAQLIFGESKALAIATALINTYQGISAQIATKPNTPYEIGLVIANSAIVAATGFAAVKNILNTDKGSSGGGGGGGNTAGTTTPSATFENPAVTTTIASLQQVPATGGNGQTQTVLVLETLQEVQGQQIVKINSN